MADTSEPNKGKSRRWPKVLLGISLALNLLVVGVVAGAMYRFGGMHGMHAPPRSIGAAMFRELPREDRRALWSGAGAGEGRADRHARQKADAAAVGSALRATPFDSEALKAVLDGQASHRAGIQMSVQNAWLARIVEMSDADRLAYAGRLEKRLSERHYGGMHKGRRRD